MSLIKCFLRRLRLQRWDQGQGGESPLEKKSLSQQAETYNEVTPLSMFETFGGCECRAGVGYFTVHSLYSHPSEAAAAAAVPFPNPPLRINSRESSGGRPTATPTFSSALGSSSFSPLGSFFFPVAFLLYSHSRRFNFLLTLASIILSF